MARGWFLGVGVDHYGSAAIMALDHAVEDVRLFRALLDDSFDGEPLPNPDEEAARNYLRGISGSLADEARALVLMWAGHGAPSKAVRLRLLACEQRPRSG